MNQSGSYPLLSNRQREILLLVATGNTDQEIADALNVSMNTVKTHLKIIYKKWEVRNRLEAVHVFTQHFKSA